MAQKTLLDVVQELLSSLDGDEVNSISDTVESLQVAYIVKNTFEDLAAHMDFPEHYSFYELVASGDSSRPTVMTLPSAALTLEWVKYNKKLDTETSPKFETVHFLPLNEFLSRMYMMSSTDSEVTTFTQTVDGASVDLFCYNDRFPSYYTTFNDSTLIFDAYDATQENTLVGNKTLCYGLRDQEFTLEDSFVIPLDRKQLSLLVNEAKAQAFAEQKQMSNPKAEQRARRALISTMRTKRAVKGITELDRVPNYGRR